MKLRFTSVLCLGVLTISASAFAEDAPMKYKIDPGHSSVTFKIRHLISKTQGSFGKFEGMLEYSKSNPEKSKVEATIMADSINTNEPKRDKHLKSPDFFDTAKYPNLTFKSKEVEKSGDKLMVKGDLTIHGVTKPTTLAVEMGGEGTDPWGNRKVGFTGTTKIDRKDFGLTWNKALETGGVLVGDEVEITLEIEADAQGMEPAKKAKK